MKEEFFEFLRNRNTKISEIPFRKEFEELLREYLIFGGFPKIVKEDDYEFKKRLLIELARNYIERDIAFFFNIKEIESFSNLLKYLANSIGNIVEIASISSDLKISFKTVKEYFSILSFTYIVNLISPFYKNLVTKIKKAKKVYLIDNGLRNALIYNFLEIEKRDENEKGKLLENFVFNEIKTNLTKEIKYWRTTGKAEIDFIINFSNRLIPIEVKVSPKISRGFLSFIKTYKPEIALVVNLKEQKIKEINNTKIAFIYPFLI